MHPGLKKTKRLFPNMNLRKSAFPNIKKIIKRVVIELLTSSLYSIMGVLHPYFIPNKLGLTLAELVICNNQRKNSIKPKWLSILWSTISNSASLALDRMFVLLGI